MVELAEFFGVNCRKDFRNLEDKAKQGLPVGSPCFLAPQKEFESPTFRLGGGRSILLSYWGMCVTYSTQRMMPCQEIP